MLLLPTTTTTYVATTYTAGEIILALSRSLSLARSLSSVVQESCHAMCEMRTVLRDCVRLNTQVVKKRKRAHLVPFYKSMKSLFV